MAFWIAAFVVVLGGIPALGWAQDGTDPAAAAPAVAEPVPQIAAQAPERGSTDAGALVDAMFEMAERRNVRQMALRDALRPFFVSDEDTDRFIVLLTHKVGQKRLLRDAYFSWSQQALEIDDAYGYAEARVRLRGISRFWLPRTTGMVLQLTRIDGRWYAKGPELTNIDLL